MGTWNGNALLVQHKCGARLWCESQLINDGLVFEFRAFAIIGKEWWKGDPVTVCKCGAELHPFKSKEWIEA